MKKRFIVLVLLVLCMSFMSGCGKDNWAPDTQTIIRECNLPMAPVPGSDYLVYDLQTRNVFYLFCYAPWSTDRGYGFMCPYTGDHGNYKYIDGVLKEVSE